jgi:hypothetical protein
MNLSNWPVKAVLILYKLTKENNYDPQNLDDEYRAYLGMQIIVGISLVLSYFVSIIGTTYCRPVSMYVSGFLYVVAFIALLASFGVATTLASFG